MNKISLVVTLALLQYATQINTYYDPAYFNKPCAESEAKNIQEFPQPNIPSQKLSSASTTKRKAIRIAAYNQCATKKFRTNPKTRADEWVCNCPGRQHSLSMPAKKPLKRYKQRSSSSKNARPTPLAQSLTEVGKDIPAPVAREEHLQFADNIWGACY